MKVILTSILALATSINYSQKLLNTSLVMPEVNVAIRGFYNELKFVEIAIDSNTSVISSTDTLYHIGNEDNLKFIYKPATTSPTDTIKINQNGKIETSFVINIERANKPEIYFGKIRDSLVTKQELLENTGLICSCEPSLLKCDAKIMEFEGFIIKRNGKEIPLKKKKYSTVMRWSETRRYKYYEKQYYQKLQNQFTERQLKQISRMKTDEAIRFTSVTVRGSDSSKTGYL